MDRCPASLLGRWQLMGTVVFTGLFSLVSALLLLSFMEIPRSFPFDSMLQAVVFAEALLLLTVSSSRRFMYMFRNEPRFTLLHYVIWSIAEIVIYSLVLSLFVQMAYSFHGPGAPGVMEVMDIVLPDALLCMGVPYLICALVFVLGLENTLKVTDFTDLVSDVSVAPYEDRRITLYDNAGNLKLSLNPDSLFFFESDDNYIKVWYSGTDGEIKQYMLRCRLKTIEESFSNTSLVRCHRKYIVNINKVNILKSEKDGYMMDLGLESVGPIPVSKTYEQAVLARFNSRN